MNKNFTFAALCIISLNLAFCASLIADDVNGGHEVMPFSRISCNPVYSGMGYSGIASKDNVAWSSFCNSALIPLTTQNISVRAGYQNWSPSGMQAKGFALAGSYKFLKNAGVSLGAVVRKGEKYDFFDGKNNVIFSPTDINISAGFGYSVIDSILSVGLNLRYLRTNPSPVMSQQTFGGDFIVMGTFSDYSFAAGIENIGLPTKSSSGVKYNLPASVVAGADYTNNVVENLEIKATADVHYLFSGNVMAAAGMQLGWKNTVYARCGYHYGSKGAVLPSFATIGGGIHLYGISIDAAYILANKYLNKTFSISLGYSF